MGGGHSHDGDPRKMWFWGECPPLGFTLPKKIKISIRLNMGIKKGLTRGGFLWPHFKSLNRSCQISSLGRLDYMLGFP
jgi:hypothetical protein